ncbi:odorant receptor 82a-like isoform X1 [Vespa velutina]|uniref:odorant receptor 82a-like isoform X1 n=1 Tax=Vespa velutina TaxID=202808 RepID=UPI001FB2DACE|nr:odorant receptor 82a-like isoform X1 [Vespa velutina]
MTKLEMYRAYARFVKRMLLLGGIYPMIESSILYRQLPVLTLLTSFIMFFGVVRFCLYNINNLSVFTKSLSLVGSFSLMIVKAFMFIIYRKQFYELHSTLELMYNEVLENSTFRPIVLSTINLFRYPAYMVYYLILGTMSLYIFAPIIIIGYEGIKGVEPKHYSLPFLTNFPWIDGTPGLIYQIQFLFETQCVWFIIFVTGGVDSSYGFYLFQMIGLLRAMSFECENTFKSSSEFKTTLYNCIKKQIRLLRCRDIIQQIYGPIVLDLMLTNAIVLCALIFQALQTEMTIGKMLIFVIYGLLKTIQAFMYSWYGSIIVSESEAFQRSVYCSKWYEYSENTMLMKDVLVILTQKPIVLISCHFSHISLNIFIKVKKKGYNYILDIIYWKILSFKLILFKKQITKYIFQFLDH